MSRYVIYKFPLTNVRGDVIGRQEKQGRFIAYADDYKIAVIETEHGEIVRIPIEHVRFLHPQEEE